MIKITRLFKSFIYAFRGLVKVVREEQNFQIQLTAAILVFIAAVWLKISTTEWLVLMGIILLVLLMELVNSAVERVTDLFKPRISTYVKEIKDIMAAAVLLASLGAIVVGVIIFGPHVWSLISRNWLAASCLF
ncbi:MAG: diacylglycerol kinase family protein [Candidatus Falkowbacteria bacterium]